jgi:hypothetical protein
VDPFPRISQLDHVRQAVAEGRPMIIDYHQAATDLVSTFPSVTRDLQGKTRIDRQFLNCWLPEEKLILAIASSMASHGDPTSWWDGLQEQLT